MITHGIFICLSLFLLFVGAESLVRGSASLAIRAGLSALAVGLTIVAFGTSAPELVVSIKAALEQHGDISIGNVVGSNSFNIGIIMGLTALICPIPVHRQIIRFDAPFALTVTLLLPILLWDSRLGRTEGIVLFSGIVFYTWMNLRMAKTERDDPNGSQTNLSVPSVSRHWRLDLIFILVGLGILILGSRLLVEHAVLLARAFGTSEAVIGLTIVAAGTSMPELTTSLVAGFRGQPDIAMGNVLGSNVFNILGILGVASIVSPIHATSISVIDYTAMGVLSMLLIPLLYTGRVLHRIEGAFLLLTYGLYLFVLWPK